MQRAVLFDIDGTLILTGGAGQQAMLDALAAEFGAPPPRDVPVHGRTDRAIARDLLRAAGLADTPEHWARLRAAYLERLAAELPRRRGRVLPGVRRLLDRLAARPNVALGLLTGNLRDAARLKLAHFGLDAYFAFGGFGDEHVDRDDVAREALAAWRRRAGSAANGVRVWVVGDTPLDIRCARAIGASVLAVATGGFPLAQLAAEAPDAVGPDLEDADRWLRLLDPAAGPASAS